MKKSLTNILTSFTVLACIGLLFTLVEANAAVKRTLIEVHTGTWCGYCPDGAARLQAIVDKHGDRAIGVAWHNGANDPMTIAEQATIAQYYSIEGYPNGTVDRRPWAGKYMHNRGVWITYAEQSLAMQAECDITSYYVLNETARTMDIYVSAKFETAVSGDIRFNAFILEDGIVHPQNGATQDYVHKNVLRKLMGGIWGTDGVIPASVKPGDKFTHKYTLSIPAAWNINKVRAVGVVQKYGPNREDRVILNVVHSTPGIPTFETAMEAPAVKVINQNEKFDKELTIKNTNDKKINLTVSTELSLRTPVGWSIEVKTLASIGKTGKDDILSTEVPLEPNQTTSVFLTLTPSSNFGIGDALITIEQKGNPDAAKSTYVISAISKELESVELLISGETSYNVNAEVKASGRTQYTPILIEDFIAFDAELTNIKYMILSGGNRGMLATGGADFLKRKMDNGVGILINGGVTLVNVFASAPNNGLLQELGLSWTQGTDIQIESFSLQGISGDPISNGMTFNGCALVPGGYYVQPLNITKPNSTSKILTLNGQTVATKVEGTNARAVVLQFNPYVIQTTAQRKNLVDACLDWIESKPAKGPIVTTNVNSIAFGKVGVGQTNASTFRINNTGGQPLVISKIEPEYNYSHIFKIVGQSTNISVPAGGELEVTVTFEPKDKIPYSSFLTVKSNATNEANKTITLTGIGEEVGSVKDGIASNGLFTLSVSPNPINEQSKVNYSIAGNESQYVNIYMVNQTGARVADVFSGIKNPGEHSELITLPTLPSGAYHLILNANGIMVDLPVIIVK